MKLGEIGKLRLKNRYPCCFWFADSSLMIVGTKRAIENEKLLGFIKGKLTRAHAVRPGIAGGCRYARILRSIDPDVGEDRQNSLKSR